MERSIKLKKPKGPKGPVCKVPKPPAGFAAGNKTMFEPLVDDVKDLKRRVTSLEDNFDSRVMKIVEDNNVKLEAKMVRLLDERDVKLEAKMVQLLDERDVKLEAKMVQLLDERDKKGEASFEDKVIKVIKKYNKSKKN